MNQKIQYEVFKDPGRVAEIVGVVRAREEGLVWVAQTYYYYLNKRWVATGRTKEEALDNLQQALEDQAQRIRERNETIDKGIISINY